MGSKGDSSSVRLRFIFIDGVSKTIEFPLGSSSGDIKKQVMAEWSDQVKSVSDPRRFRLLCMGKEIQTNSSKTLQSLKIPVYDTHPTPVNVSVLPESFATPSADKNVSKKGVPVSSAEGCCIVM